MLPMEWKSFSHIYLFSILQCIFEINVKASSSSKAYSNITNITDIYIFYLFRQYFQSIWWRCYNPFICKIPHVIHKLVINSDSNIMNEHRLKRKTIQNRYFWEEVRFVERRGTCLSEDVVGLLLHQHSHVLNITTPGVQLILHTFDLKQRPTG